MLTALVLTIKQKDKFFWMTKIFTYVLLYDIQSLENGMVIYAQKPHPCVQLRYKIFLHEKVFGSMSWAMRTMYKMV